MKQKKIFFWKKFQNGRIKPPQKAEQFSPEFHKLKDENPIVKQIFFEVLVLLDFCIDFEKNVLSEFNRVQKCIQSFPNRK